jgi:hypothetical protein
VVLFIYLLCPSRDVVLTVPRSEIYVEVLQSALESGRDAVGFVELYALFDDLVDIW